MYGVVICSGGVIVSWCESGDGCWLYTFATLVKTATVAVVAIMILIKRECAFDVFMFVAKRIPSTFIIENWGGIDAVHRSF